MGFVLNCKDEASSNHSQWQQQLRLMGIVVFWGVYQSHNVDFSIVTRPYVNLLFQHLAVDLHIRECKCDFVFAHLCGCFCLTEDLGSIRAEGLLVLTLSLFAVLLLSPLSSTPSRMGSAWWFSPWQLILESFVPVHHGSCCDHCTHRHIHTFQERSKSHFPIANIYRSSLVRYFGKINCQGGNSEINKKTINMNVLKFISS